MSALDIVTNAKLRHEFGRALSLVEQAQLTLFRETPPQRRVEIESAVQTKWLERQDQPKNTVDKDKAQAQLLRETLVDLVDSYNDPFANYVTPEALARYYQRRSGKFVGIGVKFRSRRDNYPLMIGPLLGGPLEHADIEPGDEIRKIGGIDQYGVTAVDLAASLKGEQGSEVLLQLARDGRKKNHLLLAQRHKVALEYVRSDILANNTGYLRISRFGGRTHAIATAKLRQLIGKGITALVLDLRDNPGGSTRAARAVVSLFSAQPYVYSEQFKSGKIRKLERHGEQVTKMPLAVLVNERSMSSSEIVAGALKAAGRASIVGTPTYGKGLIQRVFDLKPPLGGAIRASIAEYATLDDILIHGVGVVPDYYVPTAREKVFKETGSLNISAAARRFQRQLLDKRLREQYSRQEAAQIIAQTDEQLMRALAVVNMNEKLTGY